MDINSINSQNGVNDAPKSEQKRPKDTEFQREVDYTNTPNPAETLGRSMTIGISVSKDNDKSISTPNLPKPHKIDLSWLKHTVFYLGEKITDSDIERITENVSKLDSPELAEKFIDGFSDKIKFKYTMLLLELIQNPKTYENLQGHIDIIQACDKLQYNTPQEIINRLRNNNKTNFSGFAKIIDSLHEYDDKTVRNKILDECSNIDDDDFDTAAEFLSDLPNIYKIKPYTSYQADNYEQFLKSQSLDTIDYKKLRSRIKSMKEKGLYEGLMKIEIDAIINSKDDNFVEKFEFLKNKNLLSNISTLHETLISPNSKLLFKVLNDTDFKKEYLDSIFKENIPENIEAKSKIYDLIKKNKTELSEKDFSSIVANTTADNFELATELLTNEELNFPKNKIADIIEVANKDNISLAKKLCFDSDYPVDNIVDTINTSYTSLLPIGVKAREKMYDLLKENDKFPKEKMFAVLKTIDHATIKCKEQIYNAIKNNERFTPDQVVDIVINTYLGLYDFILNMCNNEDISPNAITQIISSTQYPATISKIKELISNNKINQYINVIEQQRQKILTTPQLYINGEYNNEDEMRADIDKFFKKYYSTMICVYDMTDKEALNSLLRMRFKKAEIYLQTVNELDTNKHNIIKNLSNSLNINGKPFLPIQKIEFIDLLNGYRHNELSTDKIENMIETGIIDISQLHIDLFNIIMENAGLKKEEISAIPKEKLILWDTRYAHLLAKAIDNVECEENIAYFYSDILRAANLNDFGTYIEDESNIYGRANANTKNIFEELNMDYDKWIHPSKNLEINFVSKDKGEETLLRIGTEINEDMNMFLQTPVGQHIKKQFPNMIKDDKFVIPQEYTSYKEILKGFLSILTNESNTGQMSAVWNRAKKNIESSDNKKVETAKRTLAILNSWKEKINEINDIQEEVSDKNHIKQRITKKLDWKIKMWDRIPQKDLFQGNYSTCCIGMGDFNDYAMPHYLLNNAYNMIEFIDNETGETVGNALCYFVKDGTNKTALVVDNVEIENSTKLSDEMGKELRASITEYASSVAKDVTGEDYTPIYISSNNNDIPWKDLKHTTQAISFIGDIIGNKTYMDLFNGWTNRNNLKNYIGQIYQLK